MVSTEVTVNVCVVAPTVILADAPVKMSPTVFVLANVMELPATVAPLVQV